MNEIRKLRFATRMAWRETRAAAGKFVFLVMAIALGTGALTAVTGFNESVRHTLGHEARALMAADLSVRLQTPPTAADLDFIRSLEGGGIETTQVTETVSMASSAGHPPVLVSVKGADLHKYPFYGRLLLEPVGTVLDAGSVAVSDDLLLRLRAKIGDALRVGNGEFRIAARIQSEPDRMTTGFTLGPRVLFTREGLDHTGIVTAISRVTERLLLKLPSEQGVGPLRTQLSAAFGRRARIADYTETNPALTRALDRATRFLSMVSLIALIVGGMGVGATLRSHLQQKMNNIAFMKCIGGRSSHILRIYLVQSIGLGLAGSVAGALLGAFAQSAFARLLAGYFDIEVLLVWPLAAMFKGIAAGVLTSLLFALPALLSIRHIRPGALLRKEFSEGSGVDRAAVGSALVVIAGLWGIAVWVGSSIRYATVFSGGLVGGVLVLGVTGALLLKALRAISGHRVFRKTTSLRHGISNLYRPGAHAVAILASLGIGVMFTVCVYFVQHALLGEIGMTAPPDAPNVFLVNVTEGEKEGIRGMIEHDGSVLSRRNLIPAVSAQLESVDGVPPSAIPRAEGRFQNAQFTLTWSSEIPEATRILQGAWWPAVSAEHSISVQESIADNLALHVGSVMEWSVAGQAIRTTVANIRQSSGVVNNQFIVSPGTLDGFPTIYYGAIRVIPSQVGTFQARVFADYPTVTVVNAADILEIVQQVIDRTSLAIRFVAGFAIMGGLIVLASSVAGTRYRRMREVAILKTVGATKGRLVRMFSAEFAILGFAAGATGSVLATILASVLVGQLLDAPYHFNWIPAIVGTALSTVLTVAAGWIASLGVLNRKPLDILRGIEG